LGEWKACKDPGREALTRQRTLWARMEVHLGAGDYNAQRDGDGRAPDRASANGSNPHRSLGQGWTNVAPQVKLRSP
jgi:hypothetical protein